ncbi:D-aminoacyl-tRNA deacylase 1 isoform X2 [Hydra vulgaris]|uniref:D-aminoacyl-tRNA deacylase n=1 Tax=Hydra vulgaris TaxID=6087 RepID=A0ABM4C2Y0_HYDVU
MRAIVQKVTSASVSVKNKLISSIGCGLCVFIGISRNDTKKDIDYMINKILNLKIFDDGDSRWKKSVKDKNYEILCVSQFTLHSILKGNKLDFHLSMSSSLSKDFYNSFVQQLGIAFCPDNVKDGVFGEYMQVDIQNDGPVTIQLDSLPSFQKTDDDNCNDVAQ